MFNLLDKKKVAEQYDPQEQAKIDKLREMVIASGAFNEEVCKYCTSLGEDLLIEALGHESEDTLLTIVSVLTANGCQRPEFIQFLEAKKAEGSPLGVFLGKLGVQTEIIKEAREQAAKAVSAVLPMPKMPELSLDSLANMKEADLFDALLGLKKLIDEGFSLPAGTALILREIIQSEDCLNNRTAAVELLAGLDSAEAVPVLTEVLKENDSYLIRIDAIYALEYIVKKDESTVVKIVSALEDVLKLRNVGKIRAVVLEALEKINTPEALAIVEANNSGW